MIGRAIATSSRGRSLPTAAREIGVIVRCHDLVCAFPTRLVVRLVLPEEVATGRGAVVGVGDERYALFDLGERLGFAPLDSAWVLLRVPYRDGVVPIALRTGPCVRVQALPARVEVPGQLFASRHGAVAGLFRAQLEHGEAVYGAELDVEKLWAAAELDAAVASLKGAPG